MPWWIGLLIAFYAVGFLGTLWIHVAYLQMVTVGLAFLRSLLWPYFWLGGLRGEPLPMD